MDELALYILDIVQNSVKADATEITVKIIEEGETLTLSVKDNGCGIPKEELSRLKDPFFTTKKTGNVGLGIPFLTMLSEQTGGNVEIFSRVGEGTEVVATFGRFHIDFIPLGDIVGTVKLLIAGNPDIDFELIHIAKGFEISFSAKEMRRVLGKEISLSEPEISRFVCDNLNRQYEKMKKK